MKETIILLYFLQADYGRRLLRFLTRKKNKQIRLELMTERERVMWRTETENQRIVVLTDDEGLYAEAKKEVILLGKAGYRCIFGEVPEDNAPAPIPVIGVTAGIIGTIQAAEAIRYLLGIPSLLTGKLLVLDGLRMQFRTVPFPHVSEHCPLHTRKGVTDL